MGQQQRGSERIVLAACASYEWAAMNCREKKPTPISMATCGETPPHASMTTCGERPTPCIHGNLRREPTPLHPWQSAET